MVGSLRPVNRFRWTASDNWEEDLEQKKHKTRVVIARLQNPSAIQQRTRINVKVVKTLNWVDTHSCQQAWTSSLLDMNIQTHDEYLAVLL